MTWLPFRPTRRTRLHQHNGPPGLEVLEPRCLLSAALVQDINTVVGGSLGIPEFTNVNGTTFFFADDGIHGQELWKSDGTEAGTRLVKDINRGPGSFFPPLAGGEPTNVNGTVFFRGDDGIRGPQLWKSDGTAAGTVPLTDFPVGDQVIPYDLTNVNGTLFFVPVGVTPDLNGLYTSDGTAAGTVRISDAEPSISTEVNGSLFFLGSDNNQHVGLWKSDGTSAGTVFLRSFQAHDYGTNMVNVNGTVFFAAGGDGSVQALWKSDGTPEGTVPVDPAELMPSYPENLVNFNGTLYFQVLGGGRFTLWKSDGTDAGTTRVNPPGASLDTRLPVVSGGTLYFDANDGSGEGLWKTDGTPEGTVLVSRGNVYEDVDFNGTLAFERIDPSSSGNRELWTSDGTPDGTHLLATFPGQQHFDMGTVNGLLYLAADDGVHGAQPWISDGTADGTVLLKDIFPGNRSSDPNHLVVLNGAVYFVARTGTGTDGRLLRSDGTINGVTSVALSYTDSLILIGNTLYFTGPGTRGVPSLLRSDGTSAGTSVVWTIGQATLSNLTAVGGRMFFTASNSPSSPISQLGVSDGSSGTRLLTPLTSVGNFTDVNGELFFTADDGSHGDELWKSDGTAAGTTLVADINPGPTGSNPADLTNVNGTLFFSADDGVHGRELWESDGTAAGTILLTDLNGSSGSNPNDLTVYNGKLFFAATSSDLGRELWQYDLTSGQLSVIDINPGPGSSSPAWLTVMGGLLYFSADDGSNGHQLWVTDGTQAGTSMVADIRPGRRGANPQHLFAASNGLLYFTADDGSNGRQLWQSDGTAAGTSLVQVINPTGNAFWSIYNPWFTELNGNLFFVADDRVHGRELWVLTPGMAPGSGNAPGGDHGTLPVLPVELASLPASAARVAPTAAVFPGNRQDASPVSQSSAAVEEHLPSLAHQLASREWEDGWEQDAVILGDWLTGDSISR
jgi:ELWxxDGT repeat protein